MKTKIYLFITAILFSMNIFAQSLTTISFPGDAVLPGVGNSFSLPISGASIPTFYTLTVVLDIDTEVLDYEGFTNETEVPVNVVQNEGRLTATFGSFPGQSTLSDGLFLTLTFKFLGGNSPFNFFVDPVSPPLGCNYLNLSFTQVAITSVTNGTITGGFANNSISSGNWSNTSEWALGVVPNSWHNVTVALGTAVNIDGASSANSVSIANGGRLTLDASAELNVSNNFTIQSGGSFIQNGTLNAASIVAERAISAATWNDANDGWHMVSSPVANQTVGGDWTPTGAGNDYDFYAWHEADNEWKNQKAGANNITSFVPGQGYLVAYQQSGTKTFSGAFNTTNQNVALTSSVSGFNLLGNPFPSAITWATGWTLGNVQATAYIWNRTAKSYTTRTVGQPIPAQNGFMVYTTSAQSLTIPAEARVHDGTSWFKTSAMGFELQAVEVESGAYQSTFVGVNSAATDDYDLAFDAHYLSGYAPQFYTKSFGKPLMVNTLPMLDNEMELPLYFEPTDATSFAIHIQENTLGENVYLFDRKLNNSVLLSVDEPYYFKAEPADDPARFVLSFNPLNAHESEAQQMFQVYSSGNLLIVKNLYGRSQLELFNAQGQLLRQVRTDAHGSFEWQTGGMPSGVYTLRISNGDRVVSVRLFLNN